MTLTFERLESRLLLAATATFNNGTLTIIGDGANDAIRITGDGAGVVKVLTDTTGDGKVDASSLLVFADVTNIVIDSKGGNDAVGVYDTIITGSLLIKTGGGNDCLILDQSTVAALSVNLGGGDDLIGSTSMSSGSTAKIKTGGGVDAVGLISFNCTGKFDLNLGGGDDSIALQFGTFGAGSKVNGAGGSDLFIDLGIPNPINLTFSGVETQQAGYPTDLFNDLIARVNACTDRLTA